MLREDSVDGLEQLSERIGEQIGRRRFLGNIAKMGAAGAALFIPFSVANAACGITCTGVCGLPCNPPPFGVWSHCHDNCTGQNFNKCIAGHTCGSAYCYSQAC